MGFRRNNLANSFLLAVLAMRLVSGPTANISYVLLAAYALTGRAQAIQAITLSWLFTMINSGIAPEASAASIGRYVVLLAAAISVFIRSNAFLQGVSLQPVMLKTLLLGMFIIFHSMLLSPIVDVSVLKAVSWILVMSTLIAAWFGLSFDDRERLLNWIFGMLVVLMLASLPFLLLPEGYLINGSGFQGVLNQPQAFGSTMALLGAWSAGRMMGLRKPSLASIALFCSSIVLIVLSEARTAGLALTLGIGISIAIAPRYAGCSILALLPGLRSRRFQLFVVLVLFGALLAGPMLADFIEAYLLKRTDSSNIINAYGASRGKMMRQMWANIKNDPVLGHGFGIASDPESMVVERDQILGLPFSAVVEKGVLPLAVLEEVGILGFVVVSAWVLMLLKRSAGGGVTPVVIVITALLLNMGESTLFSPGGMGLLSLVLFGWACASGQKMPK